MTLAERARQIDQEDFRRDSEQSLQRALTYSKRKQDERRRRFLIHAFGDEGNTMALDTLHAPTLVDQSPLPTYTFGKLTMSAGQWTHRLGVETETLFRHAKEHGSIQAALAYCMAHRHKRRGKPATSFECNGLNLTRQQWAKRLGITTGAFDSRRRKFGISIAVAMGGPNAPGVKSSNDNVSESFAGQDSRLDPLEAARDYTQKDEHRPTGNNVGNEQHETKNSRLPERKDQREDGKHHKNVSDEAKTVTEHDAFSGLCRNTSATEQLIQPYNAPGVVSNFPCSKGTGGGRTVEESTEITFSEEAKSA